jgi:hypothetical protein
MGDRLSELKDELAFLQKRLPEFQDRPALGRLATEFLKQIAMIRAEIKTLEGKQ